MGVVIEIFIKIKCLGSPGSLLISAVAFYNNNNTSSGLDQVSIPQVFYTRFSNHAHRLRLNKLSHVELSRISTGTVGYASTRRVSFLPPVD